MAVAPRDSGRKRRPAKAVEEWCPTEGNIPALPVVKDIEGTGCLNSFHPKTQRRMRRAVEKQKRTHVRCPTCGRRLLVQWLRDTQDGELLPRIPRHKRR